MGDGDLQVDELVSGQPADNPHNMLLLESNKHRQHSVAALDDVRGHVYFTDEHGNTTWDDPEADAVLLGSNKHRRHSVAALDEDSGHVYFTDEHGNTTWD